MAHGSSRSGPLSPRRRGREHGHALYGHQRGHVRTSARRVGRSGTRKRGMSHAQFVGLLKLFGLTVFAVNKKFGHCMFGRSTQEVRGRYSSSQFFKANRPDLTFWFSLFGNHF